MEKSMLMRIDGSVICIFLFILMLLTVVAGHKMRKKFWNVEEGDPKGGINSLLGALFGLWGFMLAFTFSQSGTRFETVRAMIVDEGNILRNTIIRADFFPDSVRNSYRADLRNYLEERIAYYDYDSDAARFRKNREEISKAARALCSISSDGTPIFGDVAGERRNDQVCRKRDARHQDQFHQRDGERVRAPWGGH